MCIYASSFYVIIPLSIVIYLSYKVKNKGIIQNRDNLNKISVKNNRIVYEDNKFWNKKWCHCEKEIKV